MVTHITEAVRSQHRARVHDDTITQFSAWVHHYPRIQVASLPDAHSRADNDAGIDP
jgi:hypothetical protein